MVNLIIFNDTRRAATYGVGTYIRELITSMENSDVRIIIVHLHSEKPDIEKEEQNLVHCIYIPPPINFHAVFDWNYKIDWYYKNVVFLLRWLIKGVENLIFLINYSKSDILAAELKKAFDCKFITVAHYSDWGFFIYDNLPLLRSILKEEHTDDKGKNLQNLIEREKSLYSISDRVICLSNYMHDIFCYDYKCDASKIVVISNGLTDTEKNVSDKKHLRNKWKISSKEKIILFAGRIDEAKGMSHLIKAFRKVLFVYPQSRLVIAGEGDFRKYIKESQDISTKITFTGLLNKDQLYEWYNLADLGVIPSLFESFGYVAVEMMMHELPIVATATSGLKEVINDSCGLLVQLTVLSDSVEVDDSLFAEKIIYLLQHPNDAKKMGRNGRKRYLMEYSSDVFRKNMLHFFNSLFEDNVNSIH